MAAKKTATAASVEITPKWFESVTVSAANKAELMWLYETLRTLGITQISQLEVMLNRAE